MKEINYIICSKGEELILEHLYTVEVYSTISIKVKSGEFAGASNFCISRDGVISIVNTLSGMYQKLNGNCDIRDCDSDAFITIEVDKYGHVYLFGQIGGSHEEHFMKFRFDTDQTLLKNLIDFLKVIL